MILVSFLGSHPQSKANVEPYSGDVDNLTGHHVCGIFMGDFVQDRKHEAILSAIFRRHKDSSQIAIAPVYTIYLPFERSNLPAVRFFRDAPTQTYPLPEKQMSRRLRRPRGCAEGASTESRMNRPGFAGGPNSWENGVMKTNKKPSNKFSPEVWAWAVRMVQEHRGDHASQWAAIASIAAKIAPLSRNAPSRFDRISF